VGRQTQLHQLRQDAIEFLDFVKNKDTVVCIARDSETEAITGCDLDSGEHLFCLWNQSILPSISRKYVTRAERPYYTIDSSLPVIEWSISYQGDWDGTPALTQGRIYCGFWSISEPLEKWYGALVRWVRKHYVRNPVEWQSGYVGPHAYEWHQHRGLLLPVYSPPITDEWKARLQSQFPDSRRQPE